VDTREAAQRWADVWERGWPERDTESIRALYADGAFWQQHPFREPEPGYLTRVFDEEESAECEFGTPIVDGDRAVVTWKGQTRLVDGGTEDLVGVSLLRFDNDGLVVEQRDIWVERLGRLRGRGRPRQQGRARYGLRLRPARPGTAGDRAARRSRRRRGFSPPDMR
jgi:hypothetical protein